MRKIIIIFFLSLCSFITSSQTLDALLLTISNNNDKIDTLRRMGQKFILRAKPDSADYCYRKALEFAKKDKNNSTKIVQLYTDLSRAYTLRRKPEFALEELKLARQYITTVMNSSTLERYYFFSAYVFRLLNVSDSAIYFYKKAELVNNEIDPFRNWEVFLGIGQLFFNNDNFEKAEEYFLRAYKISNDGKSKMVHGVVLNSLSLLYSTQNKPVEFAAIQKEYNELIELGKKDFSADPVHTMLFSTWGKKPIEVQIQFLTNVKNVHLQNKFYQGAALANKHMADIYAKANKPDKALPYLLENKEHLIEKNNYYVYYDNLNQLYKLYIKAEKLTEAIKTADQLFTLNKKLSAITNKELSLNLEKKYETEKKEKEIELLNSKNKLAVVELLRQAELRQFLERENVLKDATISQQMELAALSKSESDLQFNELEKEKQLGISLTRENELNEKLLTDSAKRKKIMVAGLILLTIAGLIIFYQYRRQLIKTKIINKQREDLVMLNQEIHHRVKNNLQVISSLLDLQSAATDDKKTAEKFQEGSQRVQSMAFIHQNLYQGEDPGSIDIQEYIKMLTDNLMQSYNNVSDKIILSTDIEAIKLHSDTVIPLGLIINELVSNSLKYAFANQEAGEINIVLKRINEKLLLQVRDNGIGIPETEKVTTGPSFGYKIIQAFSQKLKAMITIDNKNGTDVQLLISKFRTT